jgi:hypothetical protein
MALNYNIPLAKGTWVMCTDGFFALEQYVVTPKVPEWYGLYTIRQFNHTFNPLTGSEQYTLLLNEITNPLWKLLTMGRIEMVEPSFRLDRFELLSDGRDMEDAVWAWYSILNETDSSGHK